jgi:two-component system chemotaxis sensor kinase CheA
VSEISGRGVGMNVVKEMILALKGSYEIESEVGEGTTFRIKLPLSLSLFNGLIVGVDGQKFIIPCSQISEVVDFQSIEIRESQPHHRVIQLRDEVIDAYDLGPILARKGTRTANKASVKKDKSLVMVVEIEKCKFAFIIDEIFSIQRVVQKKLSPELKVCDGAVGVSILGDGSPAMILDMRSLSVVANRQKAGSANDVGSAA